MIVVKIQGGLGNQLFQYAFGIAVADKLQTYACFDLSFFEQHTGLTPRIFELDKLVGNINKATERQISNTLRYNFIHRLLNSPTIYKERSLLFDENVFSVKPPAYFDGFWQSERYFSAVEDMIRSQFTTAIPLNKSSQQLASELAAMPNTISVHVRRGDYVTSKTTNDLHGVCSVNYYKNAIATIKQKVTDPHFYFFSDDPEWVTQNLLLLADNATLVNHNKGEDNWQDMLLMSRCSHHIIANSSFSWWGAWLNPDKEKTVIAPQSWFKTKTDYFNDADVVPANWIKLASD